MANQTFLSNAQAILTPTGEQFKPAPSPSAVHPFGSKILVAVLRDEELVQTSILVAGNTKPEGAPQAYIVELGPQVPVESGLTVGQRVYWTGRGTEVKDPRETNQRVRAILEISNIIGIIEEAQ